LTPKVIHPDNSGAVRFGENVLKKIPSGDPLKPAADKIVLVDASNAKSLPASQTQKSRYGQVGGKAHLLMIHSLLQQAMPLARGSIPNVNIMKAIFEKA
jgi:hypothetical protein